MEATIECVVNGVTTGEWANSLRELFGEYRRNWYFNLNQY